MHAPWDDSMTFEVDRTKSGRERTEQLPGNAFYKESHEHAYTGRHTHAHFDYKKEHDRRGLLSPCTGKKKREGTGNPRKSKNAWRFMKLEKRSVSFTPQSETTFKKYLLYIIYIYMYVYIFIICTCKENQLLSKQKKKKRRWWKGGGTFERRPSPVAFSEGQVVHRKTIKQ